MTGVRFVLDGSDAALSALAEAAARAEKPRELFDAIGLALVDSTQHRFETETDPDGNPWPPSLRKLVEGGRTLTMHGHLVSSITHEASDAGVAVGTNAVHAAIHQFGGTIKAKTAKGLRFRAPGNGNLVTKPEVTLPRRAFLGLDAGDEAEIEAIAGDWLAGPLGEEGGADAR